MTRNKNPADKGLGQDPSLYFRTVIALMSLGVGGAAKLAAAEELVVNDPGVPVVDFPVPSNPTHWERCYGVVRKGLNACESTDGKHSCVGGAPVDSDPKEWIYVPAGLCQKLVGGKKGISKKAKPCSKSALQAESRKRIKEFLQNRKAKPSGNRK